MITTVNSYAWGETLERYSDIRSKLKKDKKKRKNMEEIIHLCQVQTKTMEIEGLKLYIRVIREEVDLDSISWKLVMDSSR